MRMKSAINKYVGKYFKSLNMIKKTFRQQKGQDEEKKYNVYKKWYNIFEGKLIN